MSAEWFAKKKEQLRLLGKHDVPGTKAKSVSETQVRTGEVVTGYNKDENDEQREKDANDV